jgi:hypothetical protein
MPDLNDNPQRAAEGEPDDPEDLSHATKIYDIRPQTVGLVTRGANRRAFFLAKNAEGVTMPENELPDELAEALLELEQTDEDPADETDTGIAERKAELEKRRKNKQALLAKLAQAVDVVLEKRPRDPVVAAQRALSQIGGHMELNDAAKCLLDYLSKHNARQTVGYPDQYGYPPPPEQYGYPAVQKPPAKPKPTQKDGFPAPGSDERSEPGTFSVAQGETMPDSTSPAPPPPDDALAQLVTKALAPLTARLEEITKEVSLVKDYVKAQDEKAAASSLVPLAKSTGIPPQTLSSLRKGLSDEEFAKVVDEMSRIRRAAANGILFAEMGTGSGSETAPSNEVLLMKKADELRQGDKAMDFASAVVRASELMGFGLEAAPSLGEGE